MPNIKENVFFLRNCHSPLPRLPREFGCLANVHLELALQLGSRHIAFEDGRECEGLV